MPEDRKLQGLILKLRVGENISLASMERLSRLGLISASREREVVEGSIQKLQIGRAHV